MISNILIIVFSLVSLTGVIAMLYAKKEPLNRFRKISLSFFTTSHLFFFVIGISMFFSDPPVIWLIIASLFIIASRIVNGLTLYGKNNWSHYIVTSAILLSIIALHLGTY